MYMSAIVLEGARLSKYAITKGGREKIDIFSPSPLHQDMHRKAAVAWTRAKCPSAVGVGQVAVTGKKVLKALNPL